MTDSDTESFHSAVGSLSDREDTNDRDINLKGGELDEEGEVGAVQNNKYGFSRSTELPNKYFDNKARVLEELFVNRKEEIFQDSLFSEGISKCVSNFKKQNQGYVSVDEDHFGPEERINSIQGSKLDDVPFEKMLRSQTLKRSVSQCNGMDTKKVSKNNEYDEISQKNEKLFEMNKFKSEGVEKFGIENGRNSVIKNKDSKRELILGFTDNNNVNDAIMAEKVERSERKTIIGHDGWDDWELGYAGKNGNGNRIRNEDQGSPLMLTSHADEQNRIVADSKSKVSISVFLIETSCKVHIVPIF